MKESFFVPVMNKSHRRQFVILVLIWFLVLVWFWNWWLSPAHFISWWGTLLTSCVLAWVTLLPGYFFFFVWQMKIANPDLQIPQGVYAMVVTKAPGEPWEVVQKTLEAMLDQDFPYAYDVWLATEKIESEAYLWCLEHGVRVSSRDGIEQYHQPTFPNRTKSKEGNLSFFYENCGHEYDFVSQLDADHVPTRPYLREMMRPFSHPNVGYVAAPSICDANLQESWLARARLYVEASMHGALQAGYSFRWAPMPIGSHYAVRIEALGSLRHVRGGKVVSVGTLGPELAEDHTTGLAMQAAHWKGAFAFNAIAHGEGAASFEDSMVQEFQWARSLMNVLLIWTRGYWKTLPMHLKLEYAFAQIWYPLYACCMMLGFLAFPVIALVTGTPWVNVPVIPFLLRSLVLTAACFMVVKFVKNHGWFRPADAPVCSWEAFLFSFVRWPWVLSACVQSMVGVMLKKQFTFQVTAKGEKDAKPLSLRFLVPYIVIVLIEAGAAIFAGGRSKASGYNYFCLLDAVTYFGVIIAVIFLHVKDNHYRLTASIWSYVGRQLAVAVVLTAPVCVLAMYMRFQIVIEVFSAGESASQLGKILTSVVQLFSQGAVK